MGSSTVNKYKMFIQYWPYTIGLYYKPEGEISWRQRELQYEHVEFRLNPGVTWAEVNTVRIKEYAKEIAKLTNTTMNAFMIEELALDLLAREAACRNEFYDYSTN
ncbi:MAG: hypothetical protein ACRCX2_00405 [Paraclostridium sp.]